MKKLLLATCWAILALPLNADPLDDLQKLAEQLIQIRRESQQIQHQWDQTRLTIELSERHHETQRQQLEQTHAELTARLNTTRKAQQQNQLQTKTIHADLRKQQQLLDRHLQKLRQDAPTFPPSLAKLVQEDINAINTLGQDPRHLPQQLQLTQKLHEKIQESARSLIREPVMIPQVNAVYQAVFFGCSWAIAIAPDHSRAAFGEPTPEGWSWQDASKHLPEIQAFFQILQDAEPARLVNLPLKLK